MKYIVKIGAESLFSFDETSDEKAAVHFKKYLEDTKNGHTLDLYDNNEILIASTNPFLNKYASISAYEWNSLSGIEKIDSHSPICEHQTIYFDMDGVLAKWGSGSSTSEMPTEDEIFDIKNHYFKKVKVDKCAKTLFDVLADKGYDVCIISNADKDTIPDKYFWLKENFPDIKDEQIFFAPLDADKTKFVKGNADVSVLIDDLTANLTKWEEQGGKGLKYLNGFNGCNFPSISFLDLEKRMQLFDEVVSKDKNNMFAEIQERQLTSALYRAVKNAVEKIEDALERIPYVLNNEKEPGR